MKITKNIKQYVERYKSGGIMDIFVISVFNKMLTFLGGLLIVRILSPTDYGLYSYAYNIISIALLFSGLGIEYGIQQYCSEKIDNEKRYSFFKFGLIFGLCINTLIAFVLFFYATFFKLSINSAKTILCLLLPLVLFEFLFNYGSICLRVTFNHKKYSRVLLINSASRVILSVIGALLFSIYGYVFGIYLAFVLTMVYIFIIKRTAIVNSLKSKPISEKGSLIKYSISCAINHGLTNILYTMDVFILGIVIANEEIISIYKVGIALPMALYAIPVSVMTIVFPYFARQIDNKKSVVSMTKKLITAMLLISVFIGIVLFAFADIIVPLMYGEHYSRSVSLFRVCSVVFIFAMGIKIPLSNVLSSQRLIKYNLINSVICGTLNVIADIFFVILFGYMGAAYATLLVTVLSSFISIIIYFKKVYIPSKSAVDKGLLDSEEL